MTGKLILSGGGNEKQTFELDEVFLRNVTKLLYIPIAWKNDDFDGCLAWFTNAMSQHKRVKIEMLTELGRKVDLKGYDAVYVGGGNTFKLLKRMMVSGFDKKLLEYYNSGGTVYGGSAGAVIWGNHIETALICIDVDVNNVGLEDTRGFDALNGIDIQCHYDDSQLKPNQEYVLKTGRNVIAIPEESALLMENGRLQVIGRMPVTLITKDSIKGYDINHEIKLPNTTPKKSHSKV